MLWRIALRLQCWRLSRRLWPQLVDSCNAPQQTQARLLKQIINVNRDTHFGRRYNFDLIDTIDDYRHNVPIAKFVDLESDLAAQREEGTHNLTAETPVYYAITSGTSSSPKYIPITPSMLRDHQRAQSLALLRQLEFVPRMYDGKILAFMSPHEESKTSLGISAGSLSGLLFQRSSRLVASRFAVPTEVFSVADFRLRQTLIALFGMLNNPVTAISAINPSTLLTFEQFLIDSRQHLATLLESGSLVGLGQAAALFEQRFLSAIAASAQRAQLVQILKSTARPLVGHLFPSVLGVTTWLGGNCGYYARKLPDIFLSKPALLEAGYIASEFRGSIAVDPLGAAGVPTITENFFEFISVDDWDMGVRATKLIHELALEERYYVIVTTSGGLYRYFINDIVQVEKSQFRVAAIRFVQKGSGVSSITGEKLYEEQVISAVEQSSVLTGVTPRDFMLIAELESSHYKLFCEGDRLSAEFAAQLDNCLAKVNIEYAAKRKSGRLGAVELVNLRAGAFEARRQAWLAARGREGQYKAPKLLARREEFFKIDEYVEDAR